MPKSDTKLLMREAIQSIAVGPGRGRDISRDHARGVMQAILAGQIDEVQVAVFLIALRMKRESLNEFLGLFEGLQGSLETVTADIDEVFYLADPFDGYARTTTMTPFMPAVLAACGMPSVIHGVESAGPKHGVTAHRVYKAAGIDVLLNPDKAAEKLLEVGWAYVDQSCYNSELYQIRGLRDKIVKRTALTTIERVLCPIKAKRSTHLVLGYVHKAYPSIYASLAVEAGFNSALLLKGVEGGLAPALNKPLRRFFFESGLPDDISEEKQLIESTSIFNRNIAASTAGDVKRTEVNCLELGQKVLSGIKGVARDSLCLAVGQILFAHHRATSLVEAVEIVQYCLDNGSAQQYFQTMIESTK